MPPELIVQLIQFGAMGLLAAAMWFASQQVQALTQLVAKQQDANQQLLLKLVEGRLTAQDVQEFKAQAEASSLRK